MIAPIILSYKNEPNRSAEEKFRQQLHVHNQLFIIVTSCNFAARWFFALSAFLGISITVALTYAIIMLYGKVALSFYIIACLIDMTCLVLLLFFCYHGAIPLILSTGLIEFWKEKKMGRAEMKSARAMRPAACMSVEGLRKNIILKTETGSIESLINKSLAYSELDSFSKTIFAREELKPYLDATPQQKFAPLDNFFKYLSKFAKCFVHLTNFQNVDIEPTEFPIVIHHHIPALLTVTDEEDELHDEVMRWIPTGLNFTGVSLETYSCPFSTLVEHDTGICLNFNPHKFFMRARPWNCELNVALYPPLYVFSRGAPWILGTTNLEFFLKYPRLWNRQIGDDIHRDYHSTIRTKVFNAWIIDSMYENQWTMKHFSEWKIERSPFFLLNILSHDVHFLMETRRTQSPQSWSSEITNVKIPLFCTIIHLGSGSCSTVPRDYIISSLEWHAKDLEGLYDTLAFERNKEWTIIANNENSLIWEMGFVKHFSMCENYIEHKDNQDYSDLTYQSYLYVSLESEIENIYNEMEEKIEEGEVYMHEQLEQIEILVKHSEMLPTTIDTIHEVRKEFFPPYLNATMFASRAKVDHHQADSLVRTLFTKWQRKYAFESLKRCNKVALILPSFVCHRFAQKLSEEISKERIYVSKQVLHEHSFDVRLKGPITLYALKRFKWMQVSGIWEFWIQIFRDRTLYIEKQARTELKKPTMSGNISILFTTWIVGVAIGTVVFFVEIIKLIYSFIRFVIDQANQLIRIIVRKLIRRDNGPIHESAVS
ncbi:unnamed protein product [Orchesella dallaii]|uniref:Uncharacterized protein n=1 Tax=Orchesella dallaii TaxID=48710 RepID=A0ABP1RUT9_9HEXA